MLMKLLGIACALAATGTVLVYGLGLQVQRPIAPLAAKQPAPVTTPKAQAVVAPAPVHAPADTSDNEVPPAPAGLDAEPVEQVLNQPLETIEVLDDSIAAAKPAPSSELLPMEATAEQVFVFWQPFRSRGSAQGFAQGLSARAEVPISVISEDTKAGRQYRVVLPYASEAQRLERLAKLESATRLEMGE